MRCPGRRQKGPKQAPRAPCTQPSPGLTHRPATTARSCPLASLGSPSHPGVSASVQPAAQAHSCIPYRVPQPLRTPQGDSPTHGILTCHGPGKSPSLKMVQRTGPGRGVWKHRLGDGPTGRPPRGGPTSLPLCMRPLEPQPGHPRGLPCQGWRAKCRGRITHQL